MKFILNLIICSVTTGDCMPSYQWPVHFGSHYECLQFGYEESQKKLKEIGSKEVNEYGITIQFNCRIATVT